MTEHAELIGAEGHGIVNRINGAIVHPKGRQELQPGDRLSLREAGGGGIGDPRARDRASVERDIEDGFVSRDAARKLYGVD